MNDDQRTAIFSRLRAENPEPTTELDFGTPFELLIAVMLSAQATDVGVNRATARLFPAARTPAAMLALGPDRLKDFIKTIGLFNTKAENVLKTCRILLDEHGGEVPRRREELEASIRRAAPPRHATCSFRHPGANMGDTMPDLGDALLDRMIRTLVAEADPEQVVLFGSRARGDARPDSDVDLLIVESEPFGPGRSRNAETVRLDRALPETPVGRDLLVYSRDEIERWRGSRNHVAARALREGRVLYAKDRDAAGARGRYARASSAAGRPASATSARPGPTSIRPVCSCAWPAATSASCGSRAVRPGLRTRSSDSTSSRPRRSASRRGSRCSAGNIR